MKPRLAGAYIVRSIDGRSCLPSRRVPSPGYRRPEVTDADRALARALLRVAALATTQKTEGPRP